MDEALWNFKFGLEVSVRYHDWRRATMESALRVARGATFVGAIVTLLTAINPLNWAPQWVTGGVLVCAVIIACINLWELVSGLDGKALLHTDLYRRFMALQRRIASEQDSWNERIGAWEAEAASIRADEPPSMWAVYAMCWNQTMDRYQLERRGFYRPVATWQYLLRNLIHFKPHDFPAAA